MERQNAWKTYDDKALKELDKLCDGYRDFLSDGKTERECVKLIIKAAKTDRSCRRMPGRYWYRCSS